MKIAGREKDKHGRFSSMNRNVQFSELYIPEPNSGCWLWLGALSRPGKDGYGKFWDGSKKVMAHRFSYEQTIGPVPEGLELDHLCRMRCCVNPDHLEPVTAKENVRRGNSGLRMKQITHCPAGHEYTEENTYLTPRGSRHCRECGRRQALAYYHKKKAAYHED